MMQGNDKQNGQTGNQEPAMPKPGEDRQAHERAVKKPQPLDRHVVESNLPADPDPDDPASP